MSAQAQAVPEEVEQFGRAFKKRLRTLTRGADASLVVSRWVRRLAREQAADEGMYGELLTQRHDVGPWPAFVRESFATLYALDTERPEAVPEGAEWIRTVLDQAAELPEWKRLARIAEGDDWVAGISTDRMITAMKSVLDELLKKAPEEDPVEAQQKAQAAQQAAQEAAAAAAAAQEAAPGTAETEAATAAAAGAQAEAEVATQTATDALAWAAAANAAALEAGGKIRAALRVAIQKTTAEVTEAQAMAAAFMPGMGVSAGAPVNCTEEMLNVLRKAPRLKRIAEIAGRMKLTMRKVQAAKTRHGREEVFSTEQGDDVQRLMAHELTLLGDEDSEALLDQRLLEKTASVYALQGKERVARGPIVVLLDESGSMAGAPQEWACGVALALVELAQKQRRGWCVAHFQGEVTRFVVKRPGEPTTFSELAGAVTARTGGGTEIAVALAWAEKQLPVGKFGDVVVVSDGGDYNFAEAMQSIIKTGTRIYGIEIDSNFPSPERELFSEVATVSITSANDTQIDKVLAL